MAPELAKAETFEAAAGKEGLTLKFLADAPWGSRVSALVVHKVDDAEAAKWTKDQMADLAKQFRSMAVCLDKPAGAAPDPNTEAGLVWPVGLEQKITPNGLPDGKDPKKDAKLDMARIAVQGEYEPFCIAVRPAKDLGACNLRIEGGSPDVEAKIGVVWYGLDRGFGTAAYHVAPHTLRTQSTVNLPKGITREIVVTCKVSDQAKAGDVKMTLVVEDAAKKELIRVPMTLTVHAVRPEHKSDYTFGFFGMNPPSQIPPERQAAVMEDTMKVLKEHGMNGLSGGASFHFKGFKDGQPVIDFAQMDAFVELARKHGFTGPINGYGGAHLTGINDGYEVGDTGRKVAQDAGLPYEEVLMKVWKAVDEHARKADWPVILYSLCDETRVRDVAERELEFMNLMAKVSKAYPKTLRTSGMYSVDFKTRIADKENLLYWHQRFFEALDIGGLGGHDETVMTEAAKLGKEVSIYNQGHGRYPFGLYQWSEYRKGVKARWEWHLGIMHGYQFFDLDGREPDSQVIVYGRNGILPTMAIERCREGAEDFYLYQALWNLVQKGAGTEEARKKASALLEDVVAKMAISQRQPPSGFDADAFKAQVIAAIESLK